MYDGLILADASGFDHMGGYGWWGMMGLGWLVGLLVVGLLVWAIVQATQGSRRADALPSTNAAEATLADRFARGEIDEDEYRRRLDALRS